MTGNGIGSQGPSTPEGRIFRPENMDELADAVEVAFDYRGDVTLELRDGRQIEGYLFNRSSGGSPPVVELYCKSETAPIIVPYPDIVTIAFTGVDTASGKSWEAWIAKKESQRRADAERLLAEAKARGHV